MLNSEAFVLTYASLLSIFFDRACPKVMPQWAYWSYAQLEVPAAAGMAAKEANLADWLVFCQATSAPLPRPVQCWAERWLGRRRRSKGGLGVLTLSDGTSEPAAIQTYLRGLASRTEMEFLDVGDWLCWRRGDCAQKPAARSRVALAYD